MTEKSIVEVIRDCSFSYIHLERYAAKTGTGRGAVERDFVMSILLLLLSELPEFERYRRAMVFRGGTCIKKVYYPLETRFSMDLDFSGLPPSESVSFLRALRSELVGRNLGVTSFIEAQEDYRDDRGMDLRISYSSILGQRNHIVLNLSATTPMRRPRWQNPQVDPYFKDEKPRILTMTIAEILTEKVRALLQRRAPRDVFDVWFLVDQKHIELDEKLLRAKLRRSYEAAPPERRETARKYEVKKVTSSIRESITENAWRNELGGLLLRPQPGRELVTKRVEEIIESLGDIEVA